LREKRLCQKIAFKLVIFFFFSFLQSNEEEISNEIFNKKIIGGKNKN
jgi:hypothetical protein